MLLGYLSGLATTQLSVWDVVLLLVAGVCLWFFEVYVCMRHTFVLWKFNQRQIGVKWYIWVL